MQHFWKNYWSGLRVILDIFAWFFFLTLTPNITSASSDLSTWFAWIGFLLYTYWRLSLAKTRYDQWWKTETIKHYMGTRNIKKYNYKPLPGFWMQFVNLVIFLVSMLFAALFLIKLFPGISQSLLLLGSLFLPLAILVSLKALNKHNT